MSLSLILFLGLPTLLLLLAVGRPSLRGSRARGAGAAGGRPRMPRG